MKAMIALEDGTVIPARSFTGSGETLGEMVCNTSMTGYQEILTDPACAGQLVTMSYPLIGNYGVNPDDMESASAHPGAFLVRQYHTRPSNFRSTGNLADFLNRFGILGIEGFDTRMLAKKLRASGEMKAIVSTQDLDANSLVAKARAWQGLAGQDMVARVSCKEPYIWTDSGPAPGQAFPENRGPKVAVYDFGVKYSQLRILKQRGCELLVVPFSTRAEDVLALKPDGVFLSNGPGDPAGVYGVVSELKKLMGKVPLFGICLGHQLLALALGAKITRLMFGHRGSNYPVRNLRTGQIEITSQNHGFCVDKASLPPGLEVSHLNLNDDSLEGMRHRDLPLFSVQYQPEFTSGPHDARYLYDQFMAMMESR